MIGGLVTLMGLFMMYQKAGTLNMTELTAFMQSRENPAEFYAIGVLILFGFAAKAGLFPLHIWLPNAYTVAPAPSSALLSCLLTKQAYLVRLSSAASFSCMMRLGGSLF